MYLRILLLLVVVIVAALVIVAIINNINTTRTGINRYITNIDAVTNYYHINKYDYDYKQAYVIESWIIRHAEISNRLTEKLNSYHLKCQNFFNSKFDDVF